MLSMMLTLLVLSVFIIVEPVCFPMRPKHVMSRFVMVSLTAGGNIANFVILGNAYWTVEGEPKPNLNIVIYV